MDSLGNNVWIVITDIIYKISSIEDLDEMRAALFDQLRWLVPFDGATFFLASEDSRRPLQSPVAVDFPAPYLEKFLDNYYQYDYSRGLKIGAQNIVYRESDLVDEKIWLESSYYKQICQPNNFRYILHCSIAHNNKFLGILSLYRSSSTINAANFSAKDSFILDIIKNHLALRLFRDYREHHFESRKYSVLECSLKYQLTGREERVLSLMMKGLSTEELSRGLSISANTLKKHILSIYKKLGVKNRVQLFKMVRENDS
ncbi:MAG TPA: LuxR C-terminal-related transcriptional regulator [Anaerovoracaceae bacterium]|nr:LuxR C-terminal-related transcriptional regulator [Anaerovoracaceae bacterium]